MQSFCGYHEHIENVYYAVIPFVNCAGCVFPGEILDTLTEVCSHELAEAVTDPELNAWWDPVNDEIGDICNRHAARFGGFLVQTEWSNAEQACVLVALRVACVTNPQGDLHMCALDRFWGLWYAIRMADGSWPFAFGDVQAQTRLIGPNAGIGPTPYVACVTNPQGDLHICAIDEAGGLWHTIRMADGTWPFAFGDVQAQTQLIGPNAGIGPTPYVTCATNPQGNLHVCAIDQAGELWHTIRMADGTWPFAFGDVQAAMP